MPDGFYELPAGITLNAKVVHLLWYQDVNNYIESCLGRKWDLQQNDDQCGQNTLSEFEVWPDPEATATVAAWLSSPPARFAGRWPNGEPDTYNETVEITTDTILNELCNRSLLPEHQMYVHVWW